MMHCTDINLSESKLKQKVEVCNLMDSYNHMCLTHVTCYEGLLVFSQTDVIKSASKLL